MNLHFFGEKASYTPGNKEEEEKAKTYLDLWKHFLVTNLSKECYSVEIVDTQYGKRDAAFSGALSLKECLWIKVAVKIEFRFEIPPLGNSSDGYKS